MDNEDYTTIIREIAHGLTGDWDHDRVYLDQKSDEYVNHPLGKEILRAIGRLLYERMPENARREWDRVLQNDTDYHETVIAEVRALIQSRRINDARRLIDKIVPPEDLYAEDEVSVYHALRNPVEVCFFVERFTPMKDVRVPPFPFNEIYELLMYLQVEQGELDAALGTSETALRRNSLNTTILFEAAEGTCRPGPTSTGRGSPGPWGTRPTRTASSTRPASASPSALS